MSKDKPETDIRFANRKLPETIKKLVRSGKIVKEPMMTVIWKKPSKSIEVTYQLVVVWDDVRACYVAQLVKLLKSQPAGRITVYGLQVLEKVSPQHENFLRRKVRLQTGLHCVGGINQIEPKDIPALIAAE